MIPILRRYLRPYAPQIVFVLILLLVLGAAVSASAGGATEVVESGAQQVAVALVVLEPAQVYQ